MQQMQTPLVTLCKKMMGEREYFKFVQHLKLRDCLSVTSMKADSKTAGGSVTVADCELIQLDSQVAAHSYSMCDGTTGCQTVLYTEKEVRSVRENCSK